MGSARLADGYAPYMRVSWWETGMRGDRFEGQTEKGCKERQAYI